MSEPEGPEKKVPQPPEGSAPEPELNPYAITGRDQLPFELRTEMSPAGMSDPRTAALSWAFGSVLVGIVVTFLMVQGEFRMILLLLLGVLGVLCLAPRRGVYILLAFLPFMYFLRRLVLNFQDFSARDPVLLFPILTTVAMFFGVVVFYGPTLFYYLKRSPLLKAIILLMVFFSIQVFNPFQGSLFVGLAGGMYFLIPMIWTFFGLILEREDIRRIFRMVLIIGGITALYGLYQHYFGFSNVETMELQAKDFYKSFGWASDVRIMSTFAGLSDFALYMVISAFLTFAYFLKTKKDPRLLLLFGVCVYAMLFTSVRSAFLTLLFSITMYFVVQGKQVKTILFRGVLAFLFVFMLYGVIYSYNPTRMFDQRFSTNPYVVHTLSGIARPTDESTFKTRIRNWTHIVKSSIVDIPTGPIGRGLGSTTTAAIKFAGGRHYEADSYFFELFYGSGIVAPFLFLSVVYLFLRDTLKMSLESPDDWLYPVILGLMLGFFLGSVFGVAMRDNISGPLAWLLMGWCARELVNRKQEGVEPALRPVPDLSPHTNLAGSQ